jgi:hypothetical protein
VSVTAILAPKRKFLASDRKTGSRPPGYYGPARRLTLGLIQNERQSRMMRRENLLLWLSVAWLVVLCAGIVWALATL